MFGVIFLLQSAAFFAAGFIAARIDGHSSRRGRVAGTDRNISLGIASTDMRPGTPVYVQANGEIAPARSATSTQALLGVRADKNTKGN